MQLSISQLRNEIVKSKATLRSYEARADRFETQAIYAEQSNNQTTASVDHQAANKYKRDAEDLKQQIADYERQISELEARVATLESERATLTQQLEAVNREILDIKG